MTEMIRLERNVPAPPERVFDAFINPDDLRQWHRASDDWTTPHAETDPRVGGKFNIGFGDPTGEHSFDFTGTYIELNRPTRLAYTIDDGRQVTVDLTDAGDGKTTVVWEFEPESHFPKEMQREGWNAQLTNLVAYLGSNV